MKASTAREHYLAGLTKKLELSPVFDKIGNAALNGQKILFIPYGELTVEQATALKEEFNYGVSLDNTANLYKITF